MKTIAIANQKGGTGKTTTAYNLGIALTQQGYRVLMVDFDPQGNLSCYCGIPPEQDLEQTITELLMKVAYEKPLSHRECVYQSKRTDDSAPQVDFIPSNLRLASFELAMGTMMCREVLLKTCLEQYSNQYDYCIIDCSPSVGLLLTNALSAANEVIIPMQAQPFSVVGMSQLTNSISNVQRKINPGLHIRGVLLTMTQHTKVSEHYAQALKNDLRKTKELLQSEKKKTHTAQAMIEECRDKQRQAEQERDYALSHQKKVEIPVEKPVLYQKCGNCKQTAYLKAKERYDTQREKLAGRYKAKTAIYEALMFLLIWYSVSTTLFQMIRSKIFISDCVVFFDTIATFIQNIAGLTILAGKNVAQVSNGISNPVVVGIIYWMIRILISGGCLVGVGILLAFIEIKIAGLYKKYCWDMITIMVILVSMAIAIYFADWIRTILPVNLLFLLLLVQVIYVVIRWYVKGWRETRGYY